MLALTITNPEIVITDRSWAKYRSNCCALVTQLQVLWFLTQAQELKPWCGVRDELFPLNNSGSNCVHPTANNLRRKGQKKFIHSFCCQKIAKRRSAFVQQGMAPSSGCRNSIMTSGSRHYRNLKLGFTSQEIDRLHGDRSIERGLAVKTRQQFLHGTRFKQGAGQSVSSQAASFFQHKDVLFWTASTRNQRNRVCR